MKISSTCRMCRVGRHIRQQRSFSWLLTQIRRHIFAPKSASCTRQEIDEHKQCYALFGRKTKEVDSKERFFSPLLAYLGKHAPVANSTQTRLTAHGEVSVGQLYDPPFTAIHHEGLDGAFQGPDADLLCKVIEDFQLQAA